MTSSIITGFQGRKFAQQRYIFCCNVSLFYKKTVHFKTLCISGIPKIKL